MADQQKPASRELLQPEQGEGLANFFTDSELARRNLERLVTAVDIESWAGSVADAEKLTHAGGVTHEQLERWHRDGQIIALPAGEGRSVYPLAQFKDNQPVTGVGEVLRIARRSRVAWLWLASTHPRLACRPMDLLRAGELAAVLAAADEDIGQQI